MDKYKSKIQMIASITSILMSSKLFYTNLNMNNDMTNIKQILNRIECYNKKNN